MTNMPEAKLAREAEICYATLALATDYDCWHGSEEDVSIESILSIIRRNVEHSKRILRDVAGALFLACSTPSADMKREASARMQMGVTYLEQRNLPSAMRELTRAAELDPDNSEIAMTLGLAYQARGDIEKSEEYLMRAIRMDPDNAAAHTNLGNILSLQGKGDEAIQEWERAIYNDQYTTRE